MNISFLIDSGINNSLFLQHSSFNLGVAITAISIFITLIGFTLQKKFALRISLRKEILWGLIASIILSLALLFISELNLINKPLHIELLSALLMLVSIIGFSFLIFYPVKKISKFNIRYFNKVLSSFLIQRQQEDIVESLSDIRYFYISLLKLSLKNKEAKQTFLKIFTSKYFLNLFSEHGYLFEATIQFYLENKDDKKGHILNLIHRMFTVSLVNKNSFLNSFMNEEIYPDSLSYLDDLFINKKNINYQRLLFQGIRFDLDISGKIAYIGLVKRYFKIIYQENNHVSLVDGYELNYKYNDKLINYFFENIKDFFESEFDKDNFNKLWISLKDIAWYYQWGNKTKDKTIELRKNAGEFIYEILEQVISKYNIKEDDLIRLEILDIYDHFVEEQDNTPETNIAIESFNQKMKSKIITDGFGSNSEGYYPAMLKVYFLIFGHTVFSGKANSHELSTLHIPILFKLKESFSRLYMGFKQEFYNAKILPAGKEEKLRNEGRDIINSYLPDNIIYDYESNSLTYYYHGKNNGSKIELNQFTIESTEVIVSNV